MRNPLSIIAALEEAGGPTGPMNPDPNRGHDSSHDSYTTPAPRPTSFTVLYGKQPIFVMPDRESAMNTASSISPDEGLGRVRRATPQEVAAATIPVFYDQDQIGMAFTDDEETQTCVGYLSPDEGLSSLHAPYSDEDEANDAYNTDPDHNYLDPEMDGDGGAPDEGGSGGYYNATGSWIKR